MRYARMLLLGTILLAAVGCGGGGGGEDPGPQGPAPDVTGWWLEESDDLDAPFGLAPFRILPLADDGTTVSYALRSLEKDGWHFDNGADATADTRYEILFDILSAARIEGVVQQIRDGSRDWGHRRRLTATTPPDGTFVVNGTIAGQEVAVDSSTAWALEYDDEGLSCAIVLNDTQLSEDTNLFLSHQGPPPIPVGAYDVGRRQRRDRGLRLPAEPLGERRFGQRRADREHARAGRRLVHHRSGRWRLRRRQLRHAGPHPDPLEMVTPSLRGARVPSSGVGPRGPARPSSRPPDPRRRARAPRSRSTSCPMRTPTRSCRSTTSPSGARTRILSRIVGEG